MFRRPNSVVIDLDKHSSKIVINKVVKLMDRGYRKSALDLEARTLTLFKQN